MKLVLSIIVSIWVASVTCNAPERDDTAKGSQESQNSARVDQLATPTPTPKPLGEEICVDRLAEIRVTSIKKGSAAAIPEYQSLLANGCDYNAARMAYGLALAETGRFHEAAEQYRLVIIRDPQHWAAHWTLAQTLILELGEFKEGLRETKRAKELDDLGNIGHLYDYLLGRAFEGIGKPEQALEHYRLYEKRQSKINKNDEKLDDTKKRIAEIESTPGRSKP